MKPECPWGLKKKKKERKNLTHTLPLILKQNGVLMAKQFTADSGAEFSLLFPIITFSLLLHIHVSLFGVWPKIQSNSADSRFNHRPTGTNAVQQGVLALSCSS